MLIVISMLTERKIVSCASVGATDYKVGVEVTNDAKFYEKNYNPVTTMPKKWNMASSLYMLIISVIHLHNSHI